MVVLLEGSDRFTGKRWVHRVRNVLDSGEPVANEIGKPELIFFFVVLLLVLDGDERPFVWVRLLLRRANR